MTGREFSFSSFVVVAALLLAAGIAGCSIPATQATTPMAQAPVRITVLHTNDHHGRFWRSRDNEYGLAARKTLIDRVRAEVAAQGGHVLLLDAGDVNTGVPESDLQGAEPDFRGMSLLGYDAMAVGNHEFDRPPEVMARQRNEWSRFAWLSANVYRNGERLFDPYKLFALGPLRVAVMGLTTEDTASMGAAKRYPGVSFASPVDEARSVVPQLRQRADVVIALTHMGHYPNGAHGTAAAGDVELARAVPGIDLVVGGHSHSLVCMLAANVRTTAYEPGSPCAPDRQNGAWIVQAGDWGRFVGRADFEWHPAGTLRLLRYTLLPVNLRQGPSGVAVLPEDPQALALLQPFQQRGEVGMSAPVGRSSGRFEGDRALVRARPAALGVLITRAMRERTGADVAIISGGGIRDSLPEGLLTYRDILKIQPFGNEIVVVTLQGSELAAYLAAAARMSPGTGAYPQSTGLGVDADGTVRVQGRPLDVQRNYRLALTGFVAHGGDGYPDLSSHPGFTATGLIDAQVLREFIAGRALLQPAEFEPMRGAWPSARDTP